MKTFDNILLLGRPASGKSEFIDFLKTLNESERAEVFHIGHFDEIDDFPWLWKKFLDDNLWEAAGYDRVYSHKDGNNMGMNPGSGKLFDYAIARFNRDIAEKYGDPGYYESSTLFIEFSRGDGFGYRRSISRLNDEILKRSVILYNEVTYEESCRKNIARYEEKKKHSILAHRATDIVMETFYKDDDWKELTSGDVSGVLNFNKIDIPFAKVNNQPETSDSEVLKKRYKPGLDELMRMYSG